jgi:6-pyruvoyltetrahydropterin/6-carboxytetrahydropterin synthase
MASSTKEFVIQDTERIGLGRGFRFEAGHRLDGYDGKCSTPHGHSYFGRVLVSVPRAHADAIGIVLDFDILKKAIADCIVRPYDHRTLTGTAEQLVREIAVALKDWFSMAGGTEMNIQHEDIGLKTRRVPPDVEVERVVLYETANCFVEWNRRGF